MKNPATSNLPAKLARGRRCFEKWRRSHKPRSRLPEHLWLLAAELADEYGLNRTARTFRLDYNVLKKRVGLAVSEKRLKPTATAAFLELPICEPHSSVECTIECEDVQGAKIRIQLKGRQLPDLAAITGNFWSPDR